MGTISHPPKAEHSASPLHGLDYSILQQCIHCGMCLPTCPTYDATKIERNSPRGRIALMRSIADGTLEPTRTFAEEINFCLGCLACETVCPAGVDYTHLFEAGRAEAEQSGTLDTPVRRMLRAITLGWLFQKQSRLRMAGRLLWVYQATGIQRLVRTLGIMRLFPKWLQHAETKTPTVRQQFSPDLIAETEAPAVSKHRAGLLTGCVQDLIFPDINRDTADVLLANGCTVITPHAQGCCGSLHAHNGDIEGARSAARAMLDCFDLANLDAIITNAGGCGSHLKNYGSLLADDPGYAERARAWSAKVKDIHEWLVEIGFRAPIPSGQPPVRATYHESCHLCHGQKITVQPRIVLRAIPGLELVEMQESTWCCGSAGIYNLTQPEMAETLGQRKANNIRQTGAAIVASANPGCSLQIQSSCPGVAVCHPASLLAEAYRRENADFVRGSAKF